MVNTLSQFENELTKIFGEIDYYIVEHIANNPEDDAEDINNEFDYIETEFEISQEQVDQTRSVLTLFKVRIELIYSNSDKKAFTGETHIEYIGDEYFLVICFKS